MRHRAGDRAPVQRTAGLPPEERAGWRAYALGPIAIVLVLAVLIGCGTPGWWGGP